MPDEIASNRLTDRVNHARDVQPGLADRAVGTDSSCSAENRVEVDGADIPIRIYRPTDATAVRALYASGRVAGDAATTDVPDDLKQFEDAYGDAQDSPFWVAVDRGELVGIVGLLKVSAYVGRLRRPPPAPRFRETTLPGQLVRIALQYGRKHGLLKIIFDTEVEEQEDLAVFGSCGYRFSRRRGREGRLQIEFYLDLYEKAACEEEARAT